MALSDFFSSLLPTTYAEEAPEKAEAQDESKDEQAEEPKEEAAEEEEEEPEDPTPALREECQESSECRSHTHHFLACQEKVTSGQGFKGEDCVEELMMHCADNCLAPKLFSKLR
ncbi:Non-heme 11 kDa protein of cytochrome bc1 complex [Peniophora sp. CONT]|nr:Non-heme 11 kDa protein of cytochrome bc1 complex [Peniophora sp. CONT]